ncbi:hypothetical protein BDV96DRAFT_509348 [Lophiotrema nucula]|uniref:Uncharacterized protein n=1 Tax=Lophiotrema nucula TaxID=690887 RepID=A0A6A5YH25_9PLEO|nr:hypothetical protein BDV96DRAFT_509348 [Lophiotrema nucula]
MNADLDFLDSSAANKPPLAAYTLSRWAAGTYPSGCVSTARSQRASDDPRPNCAISALEVYDIAYTECPSTPWTVCRCADAELTANQMADSFSRVPAAVRSKVVHFMAVSGGRPNNVVVKGAGSNDDRITFVGPLQDAVFAHESFHSVDQGFHDTATFQNAYNADSCVPDNYANASPAEDFAQLGVWLDYDTNGRPINQYFTKSQACMQNQLNAVRTYAQGLYDLTKGGRTCSARRPNDATVSATNSAKFKALDVQLLPPVELDYFEVVN